jgi:RNA polymerase sigma factor (sigma-70 family)
VLDELSKYHSEWVRIARSFVNDADAEDIVQNVYIKLHRKGIEWDKIKYNDEPNKYFMYMTIKRECLDHVRRLKIHYELPENLAEETHDEYDILQDIQKEIETWSYYEKNLFEIYMYSGLSLRDLAYGSSKDAKRISVTNELHRCAVERGTGISVTSMFHTLKACKKRLNKKFNKNDMTDKPFKFEFYLPGEQVDSFIDLVENYMSYDVAELVRRQHKRQIIKYKK